MQAIILFIDQSINILDKKEDSVTQNPLIKNVFKMLI